MNRDAARAALEAVEWPLAMIRATHPAAYRSGQWAWITGLARVAPSGRDCWEIQFPAGGADLWVADDSGELPEHRYGYEYLMVSADGFPQS